MSYSRRQLYAFGETLGECVTRKTGGRVIYGSGGGGGGSAQQTTVTDLPEWAKPTAQQTLALAQGLTTQKDAAGNIIGPSKFPTYTGGERVVGLDPSQQRAYESAYGMQPSGDLDTAMGYTQEAIKRGMGMQYQPGQFGMERVQAPALQQYQMGPAERVGTGSFTDPGAASRYMSPYIEQALAPQLREAQRASEIAGTQEAGQAVKSGAFGGSRAGLLEAERQRNLATQMGDIRARGMQSAYEQAQNLYGTEAQRGLQAQLANQQAGLTVGGQNLAAQLGVQQLGAGQNLQAQLANQQAYQNMLAQQEASRQYGAGYGLQGLQTALQGAGQLGQFGGQRFGQQKDIMGLQQQFGALQRDIDQQRATQKYQDFLNEQRNPYQQLEFMSNILRGTPMGTVQSLYAQQPSVASQLTGLGVAGAGAYGLATRKKGGAIKEKKPAGLAELALAKMGEK